MRLGCEWCHAWKQWAGNFGDFWKSRSWDSDLGETRLTEVYVMRRAFVGSVNWDFDSGPRVQRGGGVKIVCLSLSLCRKTKSQKKVNKHFVPELPRVVSVSGFLCIRTFYISVYLYSCIMAIQQLSFWVFSYMIIWLIWTFANFLKMICPLYKNLTNASACKRFSHPRLHQMNSFFTLIKWNSLLFFITQTWNLSKIKE